MKILRRLVIVLGILLILVGILYEAGRRLLASQYVADKVSSHLAQAYGGPVKLDSVDVGLHGSNVSGLRLYEQGQENKAATEPWVSVEEVQTDVSLLDAIRGAAVPHQITLTGAAIELHFDKTGRLLTDLPKTGGESAVFPAVRIVRGRLTLRQDGREPLTITGIDGDVKAEGEAVVVKGTIADPTWGDWEVGGNWDKQASKGSATLTCERARLVQARLGQLPFIPNSVWREVNKIDGLARVELRLSAADNHADYRLSLEPIDATLHVPSIDLGGKLTGGEIVVWDDQVRLRNVAGQTADGQLRINADLDFRDETHTRMEYAVDAKRLNLVKLPATWGLPRQITGNLSGTARLVVTVAKGQVHTSGEGDAVVTEAKLAGNPAKPIQLKLRPSGRGFHFVTPPPASTRAASAVLLATLLLAPAPADPLDMALDLPVKALDQMVSGVHLVTRQIVSAGRKLQVLLPRPKDAPPPDQASYLDINLGLEDVDLEPLLRNLGVQLPFAVAGKLSFDLHAGIPTDTPREYQAYRLRGSATLAWLTLEGLRLEQVRARVAYANGVLQLEELTGLVPDLSGAPGQFDGTAQLQLFPAGDLSAQVALKRLPLARLGSLVPGLAKNVSGVVSSNVSLRAPETRLSDPTSWTASGSLAADQVAVCGVQLQTLAAKLELDRGRFRATNLRTSLYDGEVTGSAVLLLEAGETGEVNLGFTKLNLTGLMASLPALPIRLEGRAGGTLKVKLPPPPPRGEREFTADLKVEASQLKVQGIPAEKLHGTVTYKERVADYQFEGNTLGGTFRIDGKYPLPAAAPAPPLPRGQEGRLRLEKLQLNRVWAFLGIEAALKPLHGTIAFSLDFGQDRAGRLTGTGDYAIRRLRWDEKNFSDEALGGPVDLDSSRLRLVIASNRWGAGLVRGQVDLSVRELGTGWFNLEVDRVDLVRLLVPFPSLGSRLQGSVVARLYGTIGPQWRGSGTVGLVGSQVYGIDVNEWCLPVEFAVTPAYGYGYLNVHNGVILVGTGQASTDARLTWGGDTRLDGKMCFRGVEIRRLLLHTPELQNYGSGLVFGDLTCAGTGIRSFDDVIFNLDVTLRNTQALQLPVLRQFIPFLTFNLSGATVFDQGRLRARLNQGLLRIERLSLQSRLVRLFLDGTVTVPEGRLDLNATVNTCLTLPYKLDMSGPPPAAAQLPAFLVLRVTAILSSLAVHLHVGGTYRGPTIQVQPLRTLTEEAARFFLL